MQEPKSLTSIPDSARHWIGVTSSAIPLLGLSVVLMIVWYDPMRIDDGHWVPYGVGLLVVEFIILHSGAFIGALFLFGEDRKKNLKLLAGLMAMYLLFVWGMAMSVNSPSLVWMFCILTAVRLVTILTTKKHSEVSKKVFSERSALGIALYLLVVFGTVFLPIPELGITDSVISEVYPDRGSGLWERHPERAIAGGAVYFLLMGFAEIVILGKRSRYESLTD